LPSQVGQVLPPATPTTAASAAVSRTAA